MRLILRQYHELRAANADKSSRHNPMASLRGVGANRFPPRGVASAVCHLDY